MPYFILYVPDLTKNVMPFFMPYALLPSLALTPVLTIRTLPLDLMHPLSGSLWFFLVLCSADEVPAAAAEVPGVPGGWEGSRGAPGAQG